MTDKPTHKPDENTSVVSLDTQAMALPLRGVLAQMIAVLESLDDEQYTRIGVAQLNSSIGGHVRHCLDHIHALLAGVASGLIDYEERQRGSDIETNRQAAIDRMVAYDLEIQQHDDLLPERSVSTVVMLSPESPALHSQSTLGRECGFVLSHTIHHSAMIGAMVKDMGGQVPEHFGYAPGTVAFLKGA